MFVIGDGRFEGGRAVDQGEGGAWFGEEVFAAATDCFAQAGGASGEVAGPCGAGRQRKMPVGKMVEAERVQAAVANALQKRREFRGLRIECVEAGERGGVAVCAEGLPELPDEGGVFQEFTGEQGLPQAGVGGGKRGKFLARAPLHRDNGQWLTGALSDKEGGRGVFRKGVSRGREIPLWSRTQPVLLEQGKGFGREGGEAWQLGKYEAGLRHGGNTK